MCSDAHLEGIGFNSRNSLLKCSPMFSHASRSFIFLRHIQVSVGHAHNAGVYCLLRAQYCDQRACLSVCLSARMKKKTKNKVADNKRSG